MMFHQVTRYVGEEGPKQKRTTPKQLYFKVLYSMLCHLVNKVWRRVDSGWGGIIKEGIKARQSTVMEEAASNQSHFMSCVGVVIQTLWW